MNMMEFEKRFEPDRFFITSDWHLNHLNICSATTKWDKGYRQFSSLELMNDTIISRCNQKVMPDDILFMVGDFLFGDKSKAEAFRQRIACQNIYYVFGNHDTWLRKNPSLQNKLFKWCGDLAEIKVGYKNIVVCHYAMRVWNKSHRQSWNLYGHSHASLPDDNNLLSMDIGVDTRDDYAPWSFHELDSKMQKKVWTPVDHHDKGTN